MMRRSYLATVVVLVLHGRGSSGTAAGWGGLAKRKSAADSSRRVFGRSHSHCCNVPVLAFGRSPAAKGKQPTARAAETATEAVGGSREAGVEEAEEPTSTANAGGLVGLSKSIVGFARDGLVRCKTGTVNLWSNIQVSRDIRKRVKTGHQLTFGEHIHLERSASDTRKLLQLAIIYAISPQSFPYVIIYGPTMLPSTFKKDSADQAKHESLAYERVIATLKGLSQVDKQLLNAKAKGSKPWSRESERIKALELQRKSVLELLGSGSKREVFEKLQKHMVAKVPAPEDQNNKKKQKLPSACSGVPNPAIKVLGQGMDMAGWRGIAPGFYIRFRMKEYLGSLGQGDDILRKVPLDSLTDADLVEACHARAIDVRRGVDNSSRESLRKSLAEWLELTSASVAARSAEPDTVFLSDRARLLGLGLNFLENARKGEEGELSRKALLSNW